MQETVSFLFVFVMQECKLQLLKGEIAQNQMRFPKICKNQEKSQEYLLFLSN